MYKVISVDDELLSLKRFEYIVQNEKRITLLDTFSDGLSALDYIKENTVDIAFLDIEMPEINGLELADRILEIDPYVKIIFVTAYDQYALEAFKAHAIGYLLKPLAIEELSAQIDIIEKSMLPREEKNTASSETVSNEAPELVINCLGQFSCQSVEFPDTPVIFRTSKTAELFALMIHHYKAPMGKYAILDALFPDMDYEKSNKLFYVSCSYLRSTFAKLKISDLFVRENDNYYVNVNKLKCDYITLLENENKLSSLSLEELENIASLCKGEYLLGKSYEWALETKAYIDTLSRRILFMLSDKYDDAGRLSEAILPLEKNMINDPYSEETVEKLIKLYIKNNEHPKARALYQTYETKLMDYSGLEPSPHIKELLK